ncbi:glycosyltransferase family 2 protein [Trichocoleus sp. FACHB-90]|uniref:hormogonium polysaccharide biosynthesis glycosyltransferase HpsE n=1 Tax=Cyanophyceae TaxID=3028117 RepID=UPI00168525F3|nr:hormogonium polysaccharide biosynthesis glycosyltransferase HpsE [Trichocoleus sp. FACHB-90]MBD1927466.1 glycosyltransferase family 2 protein [Trichocoleus sp. FACHB-90]
MVNFTVAIPTYNGGDRLPEVLHLLQEQLNTEQFSWEIIVIDNNSTDHTAKVVQEYQSNWQASIPLKYYLETEQGAAFARQRAVEEAQGEFIGFLDDDNLPDFNWVAAAYAFGQAHPEAGAYGSQVQGFFEVEPPENFQKIACFFALVERGSSSNRYEPDKKLLPPGAGLVVRRKAWLANVPKHLVLNHKGREAKLASEDLEAVLHIQLAGWEIWYNPEMHVQHKIPRWRLEKDYLLSLIRCIGLSRYHIRLLGLKNWQRPLAVPVYLLNDLRRLIIHLIKHKGKDTINSDIIVACEREFLLSSLISPFFLLKNRYLKIGQAKILEFKETMNFLPSLSDDMVPPHHSHH